LYSCVEGWKCTCVLECMAHFEKLEEPIFNQGLA